MEKQLEQAIIEQLGYEELDDDCKGTLSDVCKGGANAGFAGFTYSADCLEFFKANKSAIIKQLETECQELGSEAGSLMSFIRSSNRLKDTDITEHEVGVIVYGSDYDGECASMVIDALCWSVLENLAFSLDC